MKLLHLDLVSCRRKHDAYNSFAPTVLRFSVAGGHSAAFLFAVAEAINQLRQKKKLFLVLMMLMHLGLSLFPERLAFETNIGYNPLGITTKLKMKSAEFILNISKWIHFHRNEATLFTLSHLDPSVLAQDQLSDKVSDGESKFLYKFLHSRGLKHWDKKSVYPLAEPVEFRSFRIVLYSLYIDSTSIL